MARARVRPPTSGETMTRSSSSILRMASSSTGAAKRWSTGMLKNPWIWAVCRSIVRMRSAPDAVRRSAISLAAIGTRGLSFLS